MAKQLLDVECIGRLETFADMIARLKDPGPTDRYPPEAIAEKQAACVAAIIAHDTPRKFSRSTAAHIAREAESDVDKMQGLALNISRLANLSASTSPEVGRPFLDLAECLRQTVTELHALLGEMNNTAKESQLPVHGNGDQPSENAASSIYFPGRYDDEYDFGLPAISGMMPPAKRSWLVEILQEKHGISDFRPLTPAQAARIGED